MTFLLIFAHHSACTCLGGTLNLDRPILQRIAAAPIVEAQTFPLTASRRPAFLAGAENVVPHGVWHPGARSRQSFAVRNFRG
jgi:hypothetical protein